MKYKLLLLSLLIPHLIQGQILDPRLQGIEAEIDSLMRTYKTPGIAIQIIENQEVLFSQGFGYRNYTEKLPVTEHTLFPIGSVTKPLTASLMGVYQGKGKLKVKDSPRQHIEYLNFYSDEMNRLINIEDLLSHRSGIGVVDGTHVFFPTNNLKQHLQRLEYLQPSSQVRERFDYSNMGYAILAGIVEEISDKSWQENMDQEIFQPLEMKRSNSSLSALQANENYSLGYSISNDSIIEVAYEDQHESYASGAINSSVHDLGKWVKMLLNKGIYQGKQIVPSSFLEASFSEHNLIRGSFSFDRKYDFLFDTYGYGWFVHQYKDLYRINHGGNVSGFTAEVNLYPHKNIGIIILANQGSSNLLLRSIQDIIVNRLLERERKSWKDYEIQIGEARPLNPEIKAISTEKKPSHALQDYCGKYQSKAYGTAEVYLDKEQLMIRFPAFSMALEHLHYDTFINKVVSHIHQNAPSFYIDFLTDHEGNISTLRIAFSQNPEHFAKLNN